MEFTGLVGQAVGLVQAGRGQDAGRLLRSEHALAGLVEFLGGLPADQWAGAAQLMVGFHAVRGRAHTPSERRAFGAWRAVAEEGGDVVAAVEDTATAVFEGGTLPEMAAGVALGALVVEAGHGVAQWPMWAGTQAGRLSTRFDVLGDGGDLEAAIDLGRAALDATGEGSPAWAARAGNQANRLQARFRVWGDGGDLEAAIDLGQAALAATEEGSPAWAWLAGNQAAAMLARFRVWGDGRDLEAAIDLGQAALHATEEGSPDWAVRAGNQAAAMLARFEVLGAVGDLEAAIDLGQAALAATEEWSPTWAGLASTQANRLQTRFQVSGAVGDLEAAIDLGQAALDATVEGSPGWVLWAGNQATRLIDRFEVSGVPGDLEAAIDLGQAALDATWAGSPDWATLAGNQAAALQTRFQVSGAVGDLEAAIDLGQAALDATHKGSPGWALWAGNQAVALQARFRVSRDAGDVEAAIDLGRAALDATGEGSPTWTGWAGNQAGRLWVRYGVSGDVGVAREAVGLVGRVAGSPSSVPSRRVLAGWVSRVGSDPVWWPWGLRVLSGLLSGVEEAVAGGEGGAGLWGPWWAAYACEVAEALEAGGLEAGGLDVVTGVDGGWLRAEAGRVAPELVGREDLGLVEVVAMAGLVAAESSRGRWLSRAMLSRRTDFGRLRDADVGLADELDALTREIARLELAGMGTAGGLGADPGGGSTARLRVLRVRRVELVEQIRGLPGLAGFGLAPGVDALLGAVPVGSVAVVPVLAPGRSVGFLLVVADGAVRVVRLPVGVTHASLTSVAGVWAHAQVLARQLSGRGWADAQVVAVNRVMAGVLASLWAGLAMPLQAHLDAHELTPQRVWWIPNGPWTDLPAGLPPTTTGPNDTPPDGGDTGADGDAGGGVRAAGVGVLRVRSRELPGPDGEGDSVPVEQAVTELLRHVEQLPGAASGPDPAGRGVGVVPWSRMPTLALLGDLTQAPAGGEVPGPVPGVLVAGVAVYPRVPEDLEPLPSAPVEASLVAKRRGAGPGQRLLDEQATAGAVLGLLAGCPDLHAAVHAGLDRDDPAGTALEFYDAPVTLAQISGLRLSGRLAVLSACQTHTSGGLGEEHLTLTAAVQLAGYAHAIGSLTEVEDAATSELMVRLHEHLAAGADPARALHDTLTWARTHWPEQPHRWATWTHTGP